MVLMLFSCNTKKNTYFKVYYEVNFLNHINSKRVVIDTFFHKNNRIKYYTKNHFYEIYYYIDSMISISNKFAQNIRNDNILLKKYNLSNYNVFLVQNKNLMDTVYNIELSHSDYSSYLFYNFSISQKYGIIFYYLDDSSVYYLLKTKYINKKYYYIDSNYYDSFFNQRETRDTIKIPI